MNDDNFDFNLDEGIDNDDELSEGSHLTFPLEDSVYGIEITHVQEVVIKTGKIQITKVPHMQDYVSGVVNLRGKVIPILDLRKRFNLLKVDYDDRACYIIVNIQNITTGLLVDTVSGVVAIPEENIDPPPPIQMKAEGHLKFISGLGRVKTGSESGVHILLDIDKLLQEEELEDLKQSMEEVSVE